MRLLLLISALLFIQVTSAQTVPDVEVKIPSGRKIGFPSLIKNDTIYVISFWATWCVPCIRELNDLNEIYPHLQDEYKLKIIAVSVDDSRNSPKVISKSSGEGWTYEIVLDLNQDLARAMNVNNVPMIFLVDRRGRVVYSHQGYSGTLGDLLENIENISNGTK